MVFIPSTARSQKKTQSKSRAEQNGVKQSRAKQNKQVVDVNHGHCPRAKSRRSMKVKGKS
jgi:hypothetical protein